ncbi:hypothetical protein [Hoeflea sp.]|uniref:hypothetical protein n=1 Tax=Hoeflea sp. TaxID=1940281 RepID=UPI003B014115
MAGFTLTDTAFMMCPHGGVVTAIPSSKARAGGGTVLTATDTFTIAGCPFHLPTPVPTPSPCTQIVWLLPDMQSKANGVPTLSQSSVGLCFSALGLPQGPVVTASTQANLSTR